MRVIFQICWVLLALMPFYEAEAENASLEERHADAIHQAVNADTIVRPAATREQRALRRLLIELADLRRLIAHVSQLADPDARIRFDYPALLADVNKIETGIDSHLKSSTAPRTVIEPIRGFYSR